MPGPPAAAGEWRGPWADLADHQHLVQELVRLVAVVAHRSNVPRPVERPCYPQTDGGRCRPPGGERSAGGLARGCYLQPCYSCIQLGCWPPISSPLFLIGDPDAKIKFVYTADSTDAIRDRQAQGSHSTHRNNRYGQTPAQPKRWRCPTSLAAQGGLEEGTPNSHRRRRRRL